jgi:hypothetical protein
MKITMPKLEVDGLTKRGRTYVDLIDAASYLDEAADVFDKAGAVPDVGVALRTCAKEFRAAKPS